MKLQPIAQHVILRTLTKTLVESASGDAKSIQTQLFSLGAELKKDGEDITDDEVQAALLSALIDADGKVNNVDVSDIDSIKKEIKESRTYINEDSGILHSIEAIGTVLGNSAFLHALANGLNKIGIANVNETELKSGLERVISRIKSVTGFPASVMEKAFSWIASKLGAGLMAQKIAGISGVLLTTIILLSFAIYLFPSITSGVLLVFAISGMIGKGAEIIKLINKLISLIKENQSEIKPA
jgi:hypothetical protein